MINTVGKGNERIYWLDVSRALAIISISLNHAVNRSFDNYHNSFSEFQSIPMYETMFKALFSVLSRIGVPLFLMISGVLILRKSFQNDGDIKKFYRHNLLQLFITTECWYFIIYWLIFAFKSMSGLSAGESIFKTILHCLETMLFTNQITFDSLWYMPMIFCVYSVLPLFAVCVKKFSLKSFLLPMAIVFFSAMLVPNINALLEMNGVSNRIVFELSAINVFSMFMIYVLFGYFLANGLFEKVPAMIIQIVFWISLLCCVAFQFYAYSKPGNYLVDYSFPFIMTCSLAAFEIIRRHTYKLESLKPSVVYVSKISFAIYFVHIIIMECISNVLALDGCGRIGKTFILEVLSVGLSVIVIYVFSKIKIFKKYLFMIRD